MWVARLAGLGLNFRISLQLRHFLGSCGVSNTDGWRRSWGACTVIVLATLREWSMLRIAPHSMYSSTCWLVQRPTQYVFEHLLAWSTPQYRWKILIESSFARFTGRGGVPGAGFDRQRCKS